MYSSRKHLIPVLKRHRSICKERQANFNNMSMFTFSRSVLLMSMRTRHKVRYANFLKERIEFLILSSPVRLHSNNFLIKKTLNMMLKIMKFLKDIRFFSSEDISK
jgi:hypothetical protein